MISKEHIKKMLETQILPSLSSFIKENYFKVDQKVLKGEFYTQMRRHLKELTDEKSSYKITINHFDPIGVDRQGNIISIGFSSVCHDRHSRTKEIIDLLNEVLDESSFNFSDYILAHKLDKIIDSLRY